MKRNNIELNDAYQRLWDDIYHYNNIVRNLYDKDTILAEFGKDFEDLNNSLFDYLTKSMSIPINQLYKFKR